MQLLSLWLFGEHFVKTRSDASIDCTKPVICESMLCNTTYRAKKCSRGPAQALSRAHAELAAGKTLDRYEQSATHGVLLLRHNRSRRRAGVATGTDPTDGAKPRATPHHKN